MEVGCLHVVFTGIYHFSSKSLELLSSVLERKLQSCDFRLEAKSSNEQIFV